MVIPNIRVHRREWGLERGVGGVGARHGEDKVNGMGLNMESKASLEPGKDVAENAGLDRSTSSAARKRRPRRVGHPKM